MAGCETSLNPNERQIRFFMYEEEFESLQVSKPRGSKSRHVRSHPNDDLGLTPSRLASAFHRQIIGGMGLTNCRLLLCDLGHGSNVSEVLFCDDKICFQL